LTQMEEDFFEEGQQGWPLHQFNSSHKLQQK
jgi:hypothetical protein